MYKYWVGIGRSYGRRPGRLVWHAVGLSGWIVSLCGAVLDIDTATFGMPTCKRCLKKLDQIRRSQEHD